MNDIIDLLASAWLVADADRMQALLQEVAERLRGLGLDEIEARMHGAAGVQEDESRGYDVTEEGVAVLRLQGYMVPEVSWWGRLFGMRGTNDLRADLAAAQEDDRVRSVLFLVDSPGGVVTGVRELHRDIKSSTKPVHAHATGTVASAAYWPMCACSRFTASETSPVGSIGTMIRLRDVSKMLRAEGIEIEVVRSSPLKGAPAAGEKITPDAKAPLQEYVDDVAALFYADVRAARGLDDAAWKALGDPGRAWAAIRAAGLGLIDGTETLDAAMLAARDAGDDPADEFAPLARGDSSMDLKELQARLEKLEAQNKDQVAKAEAAEQRAAAAEERATAAEAEANVMKANAKAAEDKAKADAKAAVIEAAKAEGKVTGQNEQEIKAAAEVLDIDRLKALLATAPVLVQTDTKGKVETKTPEPPKHTPEEEADLKKIRAGLGVGPVEANGEAFDFTQLGKEPPQA